MQENIETLDKRNFHERDSRIKFDEEPHLYYIDGKEVSISCFKHVDFLLTQLFLSLNQ